MRTDSPSHRYKTEPNSKPVWELDGTLHIFLVGNYLHIKGDFNLREEVFIAPPNGDLALKRQHC